VFPGADDLGRFLAMSEEECLCVNVSACVWRRWCPRRSWESQPVRYAVRASGGRLTTERVDLCILDAAFSPGSGERKVGEAPKGPTPGRNSGVECKNVEVVCRRW